MSRTIKDWPHEVRGEREREIVHRREWRRKGVTALLTRDQPGYSVARGAEAQRFVRGRS